MAAFVVIEPAAGCSVPGAETRLNIFPGSATPSIFPAGEPFWVGYGFVLEPGARSGEATKALEEDTRFELDIDGSPVVLVSVVTTDGLGVTVRKESVGTCTSGLPAGWHRFSGRWYDGGKVILTSETAIEFVER
jgi:hypothetical protein